MAGGFLSERYLGERAPTEPLENRSLVKYKLIIDEVGGWDALQNILHVLSRIAQRYQCSISNVATRYILAKPTVGAAIVGMRNSSHISDVLNVAERELADNDCREIEMACAELTHLSGDVYDLERMVDGPHAAIMKYNLGKN